MKNSIIKLTIIIILGVIGLFTAATPSRLYAQGKISVLGTVHAPTKYITKDTLLKVLDKFKPDIILMELDTSLMDEKGRFKVDPKKMSLESIVADYYKQNHPEVQLAGIDVANRNSYYKSHDTFNRENKMGKIVDSLFKNNMLNDTSWFLTSSLRSASQILNNYGYLSLKEINSVNCMKAASIRQDLLYNKQVQMVRNNDGLKNWYTFAKENADFWDLRNRTMVGNIINFSNKYPSKKILVLTGYFHKYALVDGLKTKLTGTKTELVEVNY